MHTKQNAKMPDSELILNPGPYYMLIGTNPRFCKYMNYTMAAQKVATFVSQVYMSDNSPKYPYHNLDHTKAVVEHARQIGSYYNLSEEDLFILTTAAWFHDIGQLLGDAADHEQKSVLVLKNYLTHTELNLELIGVVANCILATQIGHKPILLPEKIICDADTWHFGTLYFRETEFLVQKEMEKRASTKFFNWHEKSLSMLEQHTFYTDYCKSILQQGKLENIEWLKSLAS